ncbi:hypothetical protein DFH06DRAFT_1304078 [Mycena polygramma]|nr:hypothetical protein DFH06DRAFT_1304078 [Mycena polygramma]
MTNTGEHAPCSGPIFAFQKSATRRTTAVTRCRGRKSARRNCLTVSAAYCTVVSVFDSEMDAKRVAGTLWTPPLWPTGTEELERDEEVEDERVDFRFKGVWSKVGELKRQQTDNGSPRTLTHFGRRQRPQKGKRRGCTMGLGDYTPRATVPLVTGVVGSSRSRSQTRNEAVGCILSAYGLGVGMGTRDAARRPARRLFYVPAIPTMWTEFYH